MCGGPEGCSSIGGFIHPFLFTVKVSVVELCVNCLHPKKEKLRARARVCVRVVLPSRSLAPSPAQRRRRRRRRGPTTAAVVAYLVCFPSFLHSRPLVPSCSHSASLIIAIILPVCDCCLVIYELRLHRLQSLSPPPLSHPPLPHCVLLSLTLSESQVLPPLVCLFVV
jgi:hypothetical protein